jgi:hypothetical protein
MAGKTYTKGPFVFPEKNTGEAKIRVISETTGKPVICKVDKSRCPVLKYKINPKHGALLKTDEGNRWEGTLGSGSAYGGVFQKMKNYPKKCSCAAPKWVKDGDNYVLKFDGKGNYLHFPTGVLPAKTNFTLEFEIKAFSLKNQYLIKSHSNFVGTLDIEIVDKKMKEVSQFSRIADTNKVAILAALSIADEYLECCNDLSLLQDRLHNHCEFVKEHLDDLIISKVV